MVKKGYKQTEIGVIPEDWNVVSIEKLVTDMSDGPFGSNLKKEHYTDDKQARIIQLSNIGENGWLDSNMKYTTFSHAKTISRCIVQPGHIIIAKMMPAGRAIICPNIEKMYVLGSDSIKLELNNALVNAIYFVYSTKSVFFKTQIKEETQGSTRARTSISKLRKNKIFLPSFDEQKRIAEALSDVDGMISSLEKLIAKKKSVKQGAMQELLTCKKRLPGFAGEWRKIALKELIKEFIVPMRDKPKDLNGPIPWCRIEDFNGKYLYSSKSDQGVTVETINNMNLKVFPKNTLLVSCSAYLGRCAIVKSELVTNQTFIGLVPNDNIDVDFLFYVMNGEEKNLNLLSSGTTISYLSREQFEDYKIYIPCEVSEQTAIASILSDMDSEIEALEEKLKKARQVKQGMMQKLLTGRIRLV